MSMMDVPPPPSRRRKANSGPSKALADRPGDDSALRQTGIRFMGDMPWGTHVCLFYETPQDLLDTAVCYFEAGLKNNEFCVWAVSDPISLQKAEKALRHAVPGFDRHRAAGQIELIEGSEWYLRGDEFDQALEGVLRVRVRTRSISGQPENDRALHLFIAGKQDRRHA